MRASGAWWGVQRKELKDLIASLQDGRLAKEIAQMRQLDGGAIVIVEGRPRWSLDGMLLTTNAKFSRSAFHGILWSIQSEGLWVTRTDDQDETIETINILHAYLRKDKHIALRRRPNPTSVWGKISNRDYALHLLQGLPSIGPELAERILDVLGFPFTWRDGITIERLQQVPGIGPKRAQTIWNIFDS